MGCGPYCLPAIQLGPWELHSSLLEGGSIPTPLSGLAPPERVGDPMPRIPPFFISLL